MSDPLAGITNIRPTYPVNPVQPPKDDSQSGQRRAPSPEQHSEDKADNKPENVPGQKPDSDSVVVDDGTEEGREPTIDEYI